MYWLITYSWQGQDGRILAHDIHKGTMMEWFEMALNQPESWILLNQLEITEAEYTKYKFSV